MKLFVRTLTGTHFEIEVKPQDTVADVKKNIETVRGGFYPADQLMLICRGVILNDETTLEENKVAENSFIAIITRLQKSTVPAVATQVSSVAQSSATQAPAPPQPAAAKLGNEPAGISNPSVTAGSEVNVYDQVASSLFAEDSLEAAILRVAHNHPGKHIWYLYSVIPKSAENVTVPSRASRNEPKTTTPAQPPCAAPPSTIPSNLFPRGPIGPSLQGLPKVVSPVGQQTLDSLRNYQQFQLLQAWAQNSPQIVQPLLQEHGKENPQLFTYIQEHQGEFLRMLNEPKEGGDKNATPNQLVGGAMPQAIQLAEQDAIGSLERMGFDGELALEVFIACNKDEELSADVLLHHNYILFSDEI